MKNNKAISYLVRIPVKLRAVFFGSQHKNKKTDKIITKKSFIPDTTFDTHFPWDDVIACFKKRLPSDNFRGRKKCPKCGRNSEALVWIKFNSPIWTWRNLCGREGPLSICPQCSIQVEFIMESMN